MSALKSLLIFSYLLLLHIFCSPLLWFPVGGVWGNLIDLVNILCLTPPMGRRAAGGEEKRRDSAVNGNLLQWHTSIWSLSSHSGSTISPFTYLAAGGVYLWNIIVLQEITEIKSLKGQTCAVNTRQSPIPDISNKYAYLKFDDIWNRLNLLRWVVKHFGSNGIVTLKAKLSATQSKEGNHQFCMKPWSDGL